MTNKRRTFAGLGILVLLGVAALALIWRPELAEIDETSAETADQTQISRGYELAQLGNCQSCHTAEDGKPYAGGHPLETPFGSIYAVNISPDRETGIGAWSLEAFTRAMRKGVNRKGAFLYPAFPYTHFAKMNDADIGALYAYLRSVPAVRNVVPKNDLPFPFNIRALMAGWNLLYLTKGQLAPVDGQSEEWHRGRYLVNGVAHCGACHTRRNLLGSEKATEYLTGAKIDGWFAPPLRGKGARGWTEPQMAAYLTTGFSRTHGAAAGPMGETVVNLANSAPADIAAIATYISSLTDDGSVTIEVVDNKLPDDLAPAHVLWVGACASCHEPSVATKQGGINPSYGVELSRGYAVHSATPFNVVQTIVGGITDYRDMGGPYMPGFADSLTKDQIVDLTRYVRARFSNGAAWDNIGDALQKALSAEGEGDRQ